MSVINKIYNRNDCWLWSIPLSTENAIVMRAEYNGPRIGPMDLNPNYYPFDQGKPMYCTWASDSSGNLVVPSNPINPYQLEKGAETQIIQINPMISDNNIGTLAIPIKDSDVLLDMTKQYYRKYSSNEQCEFKISVEWDEDNIALYPTAAHDFWVSLYASSHIISTGQYNRFWSGSVFLDYDQGENSETLSSSFIPLKKTSTSIYDPSEIDEVWLFVVYDKAILSTDSSGKMWPMIKSITIDYFNLIYKR